MAQPAALFSGPIDGSIPESLVSSSTTANAFTVTVWTLALEVGDQQWKPAWSPTRDEW